MDQRTFIVNGIVKKYVGNQMIYKLTNPQNKESIFIDDKIIRT